MPIQLQPGDALLIVDVQNDFLPGGSATVPNGDGVVEPLNRLVRAFEKSRSPIFATRDWHPRNHSSFRARGGPWPAHCVAGTRGAEFSKDLRLPPSVRIISKATTPERDASSGFEGTTLEDQLFASDVCRIFVGGLATDRCVLNTVKDALALGYQVFLVRDALRAVNVRPDDEQKAIVEMEDLGAVPASTAMIEGIESAQDERKSGAA